MVFDVDEIALSIVCDERVPMKLRGADRLEALRRLVAKGLRTGEIGRLVKTNPDLISRLFAENHITPPQPWWTPARTDRERDIRKRRSQAQRDASSARRATSGVAPQ